MTAEELNLISKLFSNKAHLYHKLATFKETGKKYSLEHKALIDHLHSDYSSFHKLISRLSYNEPLVLKGPYPVFLYYILHRSKFELMHESITKHKLITSYNSQVCLLATLRRYNFMLPRSKVCNWIVSQLDLDAIASDFVIPKYLPDYELKFRAAVSSIGKIYSSSTPRNRKLISNSILGCSTYPMHTTIDALTSAHLL